ncbi:hypothetical protein C6376_02120 [Streptomyces sp. P3]|uniref:hypothetical protein n=1 Tax=Streptomyces sp. P3 TaxID=2135430 RepID=UPI000D1B3A23|nr:hypothetical protein [Streptomyces sp. P3]AVV40407.1 hypothetical protein C6376_02120 [Streptomyces sp. P3]
MTTHLANEDSPFSFWPRVREFAVPASMIETATARRRAGDWAGACAAAGVDVDLDLRTLAVSHGREFVSRLRSDLRHLAPDLLRWHLPRIAPDGLLRPGLTVALARYDGAGRGGRPVHLVVRTPPTWADSGQRISLTLWEGFRAGHGAGPGHPHPHPHPSRRFRLDLHRHLWDARRTDELRTRSGAAAARTPGEPEDVVRRTSRLTLPPGAVPDGRTAAVDRWAAEADILLRAEDGSGGAVLVRLGGRRRLILDSAGDGGAGPPALRVRPAGDGGAGAASAKGPALPVLPDAATWTPPDLELLRVGAIDAGRLHPLVAAALVPDVRPHDRRGAADPPGQPRFVECRGARHRIGLVDGVLVPLDHDPAELRREEILVALSGAPLPCLRAVDEAHRRPDCLTGVRERLVHGDIAGALAVVEGLLGPEALLRAGALRDELEAAARRRITYGLYRAGLTGPAPHRLPPREPRPSGLRSRPRHTAGR